jgi:uncharacterized protein (TIGR03083 family)
MDLVQIVDREGRTLVGAARRAPDATPPSCPDWTTTDLVRHLTFLHARLAAAMRSGDLDNPFRRDDSLAPPPKRDAALDVYDANLADVVDALRTTDPAQAMGTFTGQPETAAWWTRRMAHEATVHRVDAEQAAGAPVSPIGPDVAVDGIDEVLSLAGARNDGSVSGPTAHLHATDIDGEWLLTLGDDALVVERGHAKGDVAVRGPAADLYLWLWGRVPLTQLETFGDTAVADQLRQRVRR